MKLEKYFVVSSYVSYEAKTSVTTSPVFDTAIETLIWLNKTKAEASSCSSEKSYSFYEICNWVNIDSTKLYSKSDYDMQMLARKESEALLNAPSPVITPIV